MKSMHLFSGAGGGLLSSLILGHESVCAVEWDAFCCAVLRERAAEGWFPNLQVFEGDVRLFPASDWKGRVDCIHAGVPCQPWSVAGKRKGKDDERNLWPDTLRIIGEVGPHYVFLENVPGIVSWNGGEYLAWIVGRLAGLGYDCRWTLLGADQVGAPHRRERWWLLAHAAGREVNKRERGNLDKTARRGEGLDTAAVSGGADVAHPESGTRQRETPREAGHATQRGEDVADPKGYGFTRGRDEAGDGGSERVSTTGGGVEMADATGVHEPRSGRTRTGVAGLAEAAELERNGNKAAAEAVMAAPVAPAPVFIPKTTPGGYGQFTRKVWNAEVVDMLVLVKAVAAGQVPIQALQADKVFLNSQARSLKGAMAYPGVRAVES